MTVGYDLRACARVCVSDLAPQPLWESLAVFWTLWVIPHCVSVSHLARWTTTTPYSFPLYTSIIPSLSLSRPTETKRYPSLHCFLLFPSGNQKERPFSDFTTSSKSCSTNWTNWDSTQLESFENKTEESEMRNPHEQWAENSVILTVLNFWVYHYSANSNWAGLWLFVFWALRSKHRYTRISEIFSSM